jgi:hypothetical protein
MTRSLSIGGEGARHIHWLNWSQYRARVLQRQIAVMVSEMQLFHQKKKRKKK